MQQSRRICTISLFAALAFGGAAGAGDLTDGLVAYFPFEGTPYDAMNHCYEVTVLGEPVYEQGTVGQAVRLDGVDDGFLVDHNGELSFDVDIESYTIAFYMKWDGGSDEYSVIQDRYDWNSPVSYNFSLNDTTDVAASSTWYGMDGTGRDIVVQTTKGQFFDTWRNVAVTFDHVTGVKSLYVDSVLVDQTDRPDGEYDYPENTRITIGTYWGSGGFLDNWFDGMLDELRIYNRVLGEDEIDELVALRPCPADFHPDGEVNTLDVLAFLNAWTAGCP